MLAAEQKARLKELKEKSDLTDEEKAEVAELNKLESGKTFTQDEVNGIVTKETRKAVEKMLKDLGVEDIKNAKDGLVKLKELQDKDKTELEKAQGEIETLTAQLAEKDTLIAGAEVKTALLGAGVTGEQLETYTRRYKTYDGETLEDNIKTLLEDFPLTPVDNGNPPPNLGGKTGGGGQGKTMEELQVEMDAIAGLS